jgi:tRNA(Ile)-lysidine synthase
VVDNLARTAAQAAADNRALDALAVEALDHARAVGEDVSPPTAGLRISALSGLVDAIRTRVLHAWARELGVSGSALSHRHVAALDALVTDWHGQGPTSLPGGVMIARRAGMLVPDTVV